MRIVTLLIVCCVALAACGNSTGKGGGPAVEFATACMFEVDPPGAYVWNEGDTEVSAGGGGTAEGAAAMNACIQNKAAASGSSGLPDVAGVSQSVTTEIEAGSMTETYTYGTPPARATPEPAQQVAPEPTMTASWACRAGGGVMQGGRGLLHRQLTRRRGGCHG